MDEKQKLIRLFEDAINADNEEAFDQALELNDLLGALSVSELQSVRGYSDWVWRRNYKEDLRNVVTKRFKRYGAYRNRYYKHNMRDQPREVRKKIHDALLKAGLPLDGQSDEHSRIIYGLTKR